MSRVLHVIDPASGQVRADVFSESIVMASSSGLGWGDLSAEVGRSRVFEPDGVAMPGHHVAMNLAPTKIEVEIKGAHGFRRVVFPPKSFWIQPGNTLVTQRNLGTVYYGGFQVSLCKARRVLGADMELQPAHGLLDARLATITRLLLCEVQAREPCDRLYIEGLEVALLARLQQLCGAQKDPGSLGALRLKQVTEYIEDQLEGPLTTEEMATVAGVSTAHFAREFKRATGETPHAFVMSRRLERARRLLVDGGSIADTAARCGFTDQAHLSRLFKRRLGVTPGAFIRQVRR